jgi:hypothetical protein
MEEIISWVSVKQNWNSKKKKKKKEERRKRGIKILAQYFAHEKSCQG